MADKQRTDTFFADISKWFTKTVSRFVAAIFLIFGLGQIYAIWSAGNTLLFALPFLLALLAYYNRDFAILVLVATALLFFI